MGNNAPNMSEDSESDVCVSCGVIYETTVADGQCSSCKAVR